jgi:hypothetical protein
VTALILKKGPIDLAVAFCFLEPNQGPGDGRQVLWILMRADIDSFFARKLIPLFTSYLTATAANAFG